MKFDQRASMNPYSLAGYSEEQQHSIKHADAGHVFLAVVLLIVSLCLYGLLKEYKTLDVELNEIRQRYDDWPYERKVR